MIDLKLMDLKPICMYALIGTAVIMAACQLIKMGMGWAGYEMKWTCTQNGQDSNSCWWIKMALLSLVTYVVLLYSGVYNCSNGMEIGEVLGKFGISMK